MGTQPISLIIMNNRNTGEAAHLSFTLFQILDIIPVDIVKVRAVHISFENSNGLSHEDIPVLSFVSDIQYGSKKYLLQGQIASKIVRNEDAKNGDLLYNDCVYTVIT